MKERVSFLFILYLLHHENLSKNLSHCQYIRTIAEQILDSHWSMLYACQGGWAVIGQFVGAIVILLLLWLGHFGEVSNEINR